MMKTILVTSLLILLCVCRISGQEVSSLQYIGHTNSLKLFYIEPKCGEWGGNKEEVIFYRKQRGGKLLANYQMKYMECDQSESLVDSILLSEFIVPQEMEIVVVDAVNELLKGKLTRKDFPSNAGYYCEVLMSDSSIYITDFPSIKWLNFIEIKNAILKNE